MADPATGIAALRRPVTVTAEGRLSEIKLTPGSTLHVVAPDYAAMRALLGEMLEALLDAGTNGNAQLIARVRGLLNPTNGQRRIDVCPTLRGSFEGNDAR